LAQRRKKEDGGGYFQCYVNCFILPGGLDDPESRGIRPAEIR